MQRWLRGVGGLAGSVLLMGALGGGEAYAASPVKENLRHHMGWKVNKNTGGELCTVPTTGTGEEGDCRAAALGSGPGAFEFLAGIAPAKSGASVYVAETGNHRVQEIEPDGTVILVFGRAVNKKTGGDVCTARELELEKEACGAGEATSEAGAIRSPSAIAVDSVSGNVYVAETSGASRVQEFTAAGQFVLMIGKGVNHGTGGNLCTAAEAAECEAGKRTVGSTEADVFAEPRALVVGGAEDLLYVGDEHRVQKYEQDGTFRGEVSMTSISEEAGRVVTALAIDPEGNLLLSYNAPQVDDKVLRFSPKGVKLGEIVVSPRTPGETVDIRSGGLAVDAAGRIAVVAAEETQGSQSALGAVFDETSGTQMSAFAVSVASGAVAFNEGGELFVTSGANERELDLYESVSIAAVSLKPPVSCVVEGQVDTKVTVGCELGGVVNPEEVPETTAWFMWGTASQLVQETPTQSLPTSGSDTRVSATVANLLPNARYEYELVSRDANVKAPESAGTQSEAFTTPVVPAVIAGPPNALFITTSSAVLSAHLDPENANTKYMFEYGSCADLSACSEVNSTTVEESGAIYGEFAVFQEARGLAPNTEYRYRLVAENAAGRSLSGPEAEGTFKTPGRPSMSASTGPVSDVSSNTAVISGLVDTKGLHATYTFEVGFDEEAATVLSAVAAGPVISGEGGVGEQLAMSGLQPGRTYAYRISVEFAGVRVFGQIGSFTTAEMPSIGPPNTPGPIEFRKRPFPEERPSVSCKRGFKRVHGKCVRVLCRHGFKRHRGKCVKIAVAHNRRTH